jgi:diguanylate cyclase (GGDEF)-like protein
MIDIDFFKRFNDHYGHLAGDECLKKVAQKMRTIVRRPADFCARYGGEEFVVVLPDTDIAGGRHILEKIRSGIEELAIEHQDSSVAAVVTVSIGAATSIPTTERSTETAVAGVIERADKALYQAKRQGRNRVVIYERAT